MLKYKRQQEIVNFLMKQGIASVAELKKICNVSDMSIRRDLEELSKQGIIKRTYGGAIYNKLNNQEISYNTRMPFELDLKDKLAKFAAERYVKDDMILLLEGGTTVLSMSKFINNYKNLTIFTNGVNTLAALEGIDLTSTVISCGGIVRRIHNTFVGPIMTNFFDQFRMEVGFFSTIGFELGIGFTDADVLESQSKQAMFNACKKRVMLIQSSKFGVRSASPTFKTEDVNVIITDSKAPADVLKELGDMGIEIFIVE